MASSTFMHPVKSSRIHSVGHDPHTGMLSVRFKGKNGEPSALYQYAGVSERTFNMLKDAESVGMYFDRVIKAYPAKHPPHRVE